MNAIAIAILIAGWWISASISEIADECREFNETVESAVALLEEGEGL
jgi:hypothetical protein